jgi:hypothetical protein
MKNLLKVIGLLFVASSVKATGFVPYIPSTSTYQGDSSVINIASGTICKVYGNGAGLTGIQTASSSTYATIASTATNWIGSANYLPYTGGTGPLSLGYAASFSSLTVTGSTVSFNGVKYQFPASQSASTYLGTDGSGNLTWSSPPGGGTVNSGTTGQVAFYSSVGTVISGTSTITVSSGVVSLNSNKITNLANGTASTDAAAFGQVPVLKVPTVQILTSGTAATYTTPTSPTPLYLHIRMVGGGGGGGGASSGGGNGGNTVFGSSLTAGGGTAGGAGASAGGLGGTNTVLAGPTVIENQAGSSGMGFQAGSSANDVFIAGALGGDSRMGFGGHLGSANGSGENAPANGGGGGQSDGTTEGSPSYSGAGGGSGGYIDAIISSPSSTYTYTIGAGGTAGSSAGTGGSGVIIVEAHYQ